MKIYFDGDSFTRGCELLNYTESRFSRLISDHYNAEECNFAVNGSGNSTIARRLIVENNIKRYDLAIIQMSLPSRSEYYNGSEYKRLHKLAREYYKINVYHDQFGKDYEYLYYKAIKDHCKLRNIPLVITTNRSYKSEEANSDQRINFNLNLNKYPRAKYGHPNETGHRMIADDIIKIIKDRYENLF